MNAMIRGTLWRRVIMPGDVSRLLQWLPDSCKRKDIEDVIYRSRFDVLVTDRRNNKAVALLYHGKYHCAPVIVSIHSGALVQKICNHYRQDGHEILDRPALARVLYRYARRRIIPIGIPENLYKAVAGIIAYAHQRREQGRVGEAG